MFSHLITGRVTPSKYSQSKSDEKMKHHCQLPNRCHLVWKSICFWIALVSLVLSPSMTEARHIDMYTKPHRRLKMISQHNQVKRLSSDINRKNHGSYETALMIIRGGGENVGELAVIDVTHKPEAQRQPTSSVSNMYQEARGQARRIRRKEFFILFAARIGFLLGVPLSVISLVLTSACCVLLTALRILTLGFVFGNVQKLGVSLFRINGAFLMACLTGIFNPYFAIFGLLAAVGIGVAEMAEPLLRIRYAKEVRRLKHLHKLISDPVLVETLSIVVQRAQTVSSSVVHAGNSGQRRLKGAVHNVRSQHGLTTKRYARAVHDSSVQLVDTLLESSTAMDVQHVMQRRLPDPVIRWASDQIASLRKSGILEEAAGRAVKALQRDLQQATAIMPYLQALQEVAKKEQRKALKQI